MTNLFGNAVKYAHTFIEVTLVIDDERKELNIVVINDGDIIPTDMREEVFKPFVRLNNTTASQSGTGIGLALSRSLAQLHQGNLFIQDYTEYNSFCLTLPIITDSNDSYLSLAVAPPEAPYSSPVILIIEDDLDLLTFIVKQLSAYTILTATNGKEALSILDNNTANLIITDIMMPQMDGIEFCQILKSNINYSHLPIILLTAKTNLQSKIEGLEAGADMYIEKPFSVEYLKACVASLIQNRIKLKETFASSPLVATNSMAFTKADEEFLKKINEIILNNIDNPEFSMDDMFETLHMSRSVFYRKIKGILNMSPSEYLRLERLKKAAELLLEGNSRINEVCYLVGFNSPSYFAKCFHKQFGILPKDFVNGKK